MTPYERFEKEVSACEKCQLHVTRTKVVVDRGNPSAKLAFIGEAPGFNEDKQGEAFVGLAGQELDRFLQDEGLGKDDYVIFNVLKCVSPHTRVVMADGTRKLIREIVNKKLTTPVLSVDASGRFVARRVVGWYSSPVADRSTLTLSYRHAKGGPHGFTGVTLTADHRVLTRRGWIPAGELAVTDEIATGTPAPGPRATQLILGMMLGDGCSGRTLTTGHGKRQRPWARLKGRLLEQFGVAYDEQMVSARRGDRKRHRVVLLRTRANPFWRWLASKFYVAKITSKRHRKKIVPFDLVERLDDFGVAVWYGDDGNLVTHRLTRDGRRVPRKSALAELATNGFSRKEVERLAQLLCRKGFECRARRGSGWRIKFTASGTRALLFRVARYLPPCLRYKLTPESAAAVPFEPASYAPEQPTVFWDNVVVRKLQNRNLLRSKFMCIDVEDTHAFVTPGGVLHNCRPPENKFPGENGSHVGVEAVRECLGWLDSQFKLIAPKVVVFVGKKAAQWTLFRGKGRMPTMNEITRTWYRSEDYPGVEFFAIYHTAYLLRMKKQDPSEAQEIEEQTVRSIHRAVFALKGKLPKKSKPVVIPALSFKRSTNQGSLF